MPKASAFQGNFNGGEFSPLMYGRVDADRYKTGLAKCLNYIPTIQGGLTRRSGSYSVADVKLTSQGAYHTRLIPFEFSKTQAYMIEMGHNYFRFYKDRSPITEAPLVITGVSNAASGIVVTSASHGLSNNDRVLIASVAGFSLIDAVSTYSCLNNREYVVKNVTTNTFEIQDPIWGAIAGTLYSSYTSGGTASKIYQVASAIDGADVYDFQYTQSDDVLYLVHPEYQPAKITRTSHTAWTLSDFGNLDGPYMASSVNSAAATLTPGVDFTVGTGRTLTASSTIGINSDTGFQSTDVGRWVRTRTGTQWGYAKITAVADTTHCTIQIYASLVSTAAKTYQNWKLGLWSATTGYPTCCVFHEDRLVFGGAGAYPQAFAGSRKGDYENFAPSDLDSSGTIASDHGYVFNLNANDVNYMAWLTSDEKGLLMGTKGGEWVAKPSTNSDGFISPTSIDVKRATSHGSASIQPCQVGKATMFIQGAGRKLREMTYFYDVDGFRAGDLTVLSEHITQGGLLQLAYQREPQSLVWGVRADGSLVTMTYERDIDSFKVGWSRHEIGGIGDTAGNKAVVESVAALPSTDGTYTDVWIIVRRYINGTTVRSIEYLTKIFQDEDSAEDAFFVDGGLTYHSPITLSAIVATEAEAVLTVLSSGSHGFSTGDEVKLSELPASAAYLNGATFTIVVLSATSFSLTGTSSTEFIAYAESHGYTLGTLGGTLTLSVATSFVTKLITTVSGIGHLEGETVSILADGALQPDAVVSKGVLTLAYPAAVVNFGLNYQSDGQILRLDAGSADGTAFGKNRRTHRVGFLLHRTSGFSFGNDFDNLNEVIFRNAADPITTSVPLFSGIISENCDAGYDFENQICWRQNTPLPGTILAVMPQLVTQDRG